MTRYFCVALIVFQYLLIGATKVSAQSLITVSSGETITNSGKSMMLLTDVEHNLKIEDVIHHKGFKPVTVDVPNLGNSDYAHWLKLRVRNNTNDPQLVLQIPLPTLDYVDFYQLDSNNKVIYDEFIGDRRSYYNRRFDNPFSTFVFSVKPGEETSLILRVKGSEQLQVPLIIAQNSIMSSKNADSFLVFGLYAGVLMSMFIYNLFLYISTKDDTYLYYIVYIFFIGLLQANFQGFPFKYLWPNNQFLSTYAVYVFTPLAALAALEFMKKFLHTREFIPKHHKYLNLFYVPYSIAIIMLFFGLMSLSYQLLQLTAMVIAISMLYVAYSISRKGNRSARYFLIAWIVFLTGLCFFVLKDYNILPFNTLTYNMMPLGSALEVMLLSFALADKINTFKKEKEESQAEALRVSKENERLIREQNIELEEKVNARTLELQNSYNSLEVALKDLKEAQSQLVDSEKMAGLGQLTAGIAHEINNPINFVTSNIKPLELDIDELNEVIHMYENLDLNADLDAQLTAIENFKKRIDISFVRDEIKSLLNGIGEGAKRTAEIIRSLKNFSRLDENDTKPVDLNEGLESTLVLVRSTIPSNLTITRNYGSLPKVECLPGKINQVFMNLISNAIQAIKGKGTTEEAEEIAITTWHEGDHVKISVKDTGPGMTEEVKQKIFEPFFTTKDVGEGTGLGLSIVFRIIENHNGQIDVLTNLNQGTEFIITLPLVSK